MFCKNCGKQIEPNSKFCQYCGQNLNGVNTTVNNNVMVPNYASNMNYNSVPSQPMTNNYNNIPTMPNNVSQPKSDNPILIMMIVVFLILAVAIPVVVYLVSGNDDSSLEKESSREDVVEPEYPDIEQPDTPVYPDIEEPDVPSNNNDTKVINNGGYNYTIPSNYMFEYYEENLVVYDDSTEWFLMFAIAEYPYSTYRQNIDVVDAELRDEYDNVTTEIKKYQNVEYIETDMTTEDISMRMLYFSVDKDTTALVILIPMFETVSFDSIFKIAFPIVQSIEEDSKHVL